jgi:hypothetical protein
MGMFFLGVFIGAFLGVIAVGLTAGAKCGECGEWMQKKLEELSKGSSSEP